MRYVMGWLLSSMIIAATATTARADELDKQTQKAAVQMAEAFKKADYRNIGVLKFEVQTGGENGPVSMNVGRMNEVMATRLENAFLRVMATNLKLKDSPIGVSRGASDQAAKRDPKANFDSATSRKSLFTPTYKMVWGEPTTLDVIVLGRIVLAADQKKIHVAFQYFDRKDPAKWQTSYRSASLGMTRQYLTDLGIPYVVSKNAIVARAMGDSSTDFEMSLESEGNASPNETPPVKSNPMNPNEAFNTTYGLVEMKVFYDTAEQKIGANESLTPPMEGQKIHFTLKSREKVGVTLTVNGQNTADGLPAISASNRVSRWILEPNREYGIHGFYKDGKVQEFIASDPMAAIGAGKILSVLANSDKVGQIELTVFRETKTKVESDSPTPKVEANKPPDTRADNRDYNGTEPSLAESMKKLNSETKTSEKSLIIPGSIGDRVLETEQLNLETEPNFTRKLTYYKRNADSKSSP